MFLEHGKWRVTKAIFEVTCGTYCKHLSNIYVRVRNN